MKMYQNVAKSWKMAFSDTSSEKLEGNNIQPSKISDDFTT